ncbi:MAG: hypothetical protein ACRDRX_08370 [Pseudonocardiaceae bacterium]
MLIKPLAQTEAVVLVAFMLSRLISVAGSSPWLVQSLLWYAAIAALVRYAWYVLEWWVEVVIVTDKRFMITSGIVVRKSSMMPIGKVIEYLPRPEEVVHAISELILSEKKRK